MRRRDRQSQLGLLPRMEARVGQKGTTYRYHPAEGKPVNLGHDRAEAIRRVLDMNGRADDHGTVAALWRQYQLTPWWKKLSERTKDDYANECSAPLLKVFGEAQASAIRPADVNRYLRTERADAPVRANREVALLSNLMNHAVECGMIDRNPCHEVRRNPERARKALPIAEELERFLGWLRGRSKQWGVIAAMAEFAARAGSRRSEFLRATVFQIRRGEARLLRAKQRDDEVLDVIELPDDLMARLESLPRPEGCTLIFPNRRGQSYTDSGFKSMWSHAMADAMKAGVVTQRFTFHDLRAHYTTLHKAAIGVLPELHRDPGTTARVYDRTKVVRRRGSVIDQPFFDSRLDPSAATNETVISAGAAEDARR